MNQPTTQPDDDVLAGRWVPIPYGARRYKICRLLPGRFRQQEESAEIFDTLGQARAECRRRDGGGENP